MLKKILVFSIIFTLSSAAARAEVDKLVAGDAADISGTVNIYFMSDVSDKSVSDLSVTLNDINNNYPLVKAIHLYISSSGGDPLAGQVAYWNIKTSKIPVSTINIAEVTSAATYIFCASDERSAMPGAQFLFHPGSTKLENATLYPDDILRLKKRLELLNRFDWVAYKPCMNLDDAQLSKLSESEYFRKNIDETEAEKIDLIKNITTHIPYAGATFYILADNQGAN